MNLAPVTELLERRIGLDAASLGTATLRTAVTERMRALGIVDPIAFADLLADQADEFEGLTNRLLVPETWFFRGGDLFAVLANEIAIRIRSSPSDRVIRVLCLPCSTGEEPYSLAMALLDAGVPTERWRIDGVDLSQRGIDAANAGTYREFSFRQTSPEMRARYFHPKGADWTLDPTVRGLVHFQVGNIMDATRLEDVLYDVILCRNLLIYLTPDARRHAIENLERLLAPEGLIAVGHAEPQILAARAYQRFGPETCFLYQRTTAVAPAPLPPSAPRFIWSKSQSVVVAPPANAKPATANTSVKATSSLTEARRLADHNQLDDALAMCREILTRSGPSADAFTLLGIVEQALGKLTEANDAFRKALYLDPDHREALTHAMLLSSRLGEETRTVALRERLARIGGAK